MGANDLTLAFVVRWRGQILKELSVEEALALLAEASKQAGGDPQAAAAALRATLYRLMRSAV